MLIKNKTATGLGLALALGITGAQAAMVNFTVTGDVVVPGSNAFGLSSGDTITVNGTFDDSALISGNGAVYFDISNLSNTFELNVGTSLFHEYDDLSYSVGGNPSLTFSNYQLTDFNFLSSDYGFSSWGLGFDDGATMYGTWQTDVQLTAVPVPAALWLFGAGLIGLAGFLRKKQ